MVCSHIWDVGGLNRDGVQEEQKSGRRTMGKIGLCGHYSHDETVLNGQTVKTEILTEALRDRFGEDSILCCDTSDCRRHPVRFLGRCLRMVRECDNIIMLPAQSALPVLAKLFAGLNHIYHRRLHYYVVGGWLCEALEKHDGLEDRLKEFQGIYVELHSMERDLCARGFTNVRFVPKFRKLQIVDSADMPREIPRIMKLCLFSRVMKEKGVEDAVQAVQKANQILGYIAYNLDIYGQIDARYAERFEEVQKTFSQEVRYTGIVDFRKSTAVLKDYFALLFPTYYEGEGYANTVVDAFAAGLPVIATDWKYNAEVIRDGEDGIIYDTQEQDALLKILLDVAHKPEMVFRMKGTARERAFEYDPQNAIKPLVENLL